MPRKNVLSRGATPGAASSAGSSGGASSRGSSRAPSSSQSAPAASASVGNWTPEKIEKRIKGTIEQFSDLKSTEELEADTKEMPAGMWEVKFVSTAFKFIFTCKTSQRAAVGATIAHLLSVKKLMEAHLVKGLEQSQVLHTLPDLQIDAPKAAEWIGDAFADIFNGGDAKPAQTVPRIVSMLLGADNGGFGDNFDILCSVIACTVLACEGEAAEQILSIPAVELIVGRATSMCAIDGRRAPRYAESLVKALVAKAAAGSAFALLAAQAPEGKARETITAQAAKACAAAASTIGQKGAVASFAVAAALARAVEGREGVTDADKGKFDAELCKAAGADAGADAELQALALLGAQNFASMKDRNLKSKLSADVFALLQETGVASADGAKAWKAAGGKHGVAGGERFDEVAAASGL